MATDTQKKSFFGGLKSLIVEELPEQQKKEIEKTVARPPSPSAPEQHSFSPSSKADPQALEKLEARVKDGAPPVYENFMEQFQTLAEVIPDEGTRLKAALKTSHTTASDMVTAIGQILGSLERARGDFLKSFEENLNSAESKSKQSIAATEDLIISKEAQLKAIQDEIISLRSKKESDSQHFNDEHQRLMTISNGFELAYTQVVSRLTDQKTKISTKG